MGRALVLAASHLGRTGTNPSVGCVLTDPDGNIVAEAVTAEGGRPHAEETALAAAGDRVRGGTAYVTLEPCRERSSGAPACSTRLAESGVGRVVIALCDIHPLGAGGADQLRAAGIAVEIGLCGRRARRLYESFFRSARRRC